MNYRIVDKIAYDNYVLGGSSDVCFRIGLAGLCGEGCPDYGKRDGCTNSNESSENEKD